MSEPANIQLPPWSKPLFKNGDEYKYFAIHGGRGSGKSRSLATILLVKAAQAKHRVLCCREVQKSIKDSVKKLLDDEIDRLGWRSGFKSTETSIRCQNGSEFIFMGLAHNPDSVKSTEGITLCWVEEAQTLSQGSISTLIPTIRQPGAQIFFTWNPKSIKDPVDAMFRGDETPPRSFVRQVNYTDNPWFPDVLREEMEYDKKRDRGKYLHVWEGQYLERSNANVFQDWRVEPFETPEDAFLRYGCDWGFSVDPTVLIRCFTIGRKLYFDYEAYKVGCDIDDTPALFAEVPDSDKWPIIADSASPERISYMRKHGYPKMMKAKKGQKSVEEGIEFMRSHEIIVHPRCKHMAEELALYKYKIDPVTEEVTNVLEDKNNHLCIAEGTPVYMGDGVCKNIEDIVAGDKVWTRGGAQKVLWAGETDRDRDCVLITMEDGLPLICTPDHKVLSDRGWVEAGDLRVTDSVLQAGLGGDLAAVPDWACLKAHDNSGSLLPHIFGGHTISKVLNVRSGGKHTVYDLSVMNFKEFYAGFTLVQNCDAARYALEAVRRTVKNARKQPKIMPIPSLNYWGKR